MIGSNWPDPLHAHSGFGAPHDTPPFWLIVSAMYGDGQLPEHGLAAVPGRQQEDPATRIGRDRRLPVVGGRARSGSRRPSRSCPPRPRHRIAFPPGRQPRRIGRLEGLAPSLDALALFGGLGFGIVVARFGLGRVGVLGGVRLARVGVLGGRRFARGSRRSGPAGKPIRWGWRRPRPDQDSRDQEGDHADGEHAETRAGSPHLGSSQRSGPAALRSTDRGSLRPVTDGRKTLSQRPRCAIARPVTTGRPSASEMPRFQAIGLCPREADGRTLQDEGGYQHAHPACRRWFPIVRPRQRPRRRVAAAGRRSSPHRQRRSRRDRLRGASPWASSRRIGRETVDVDAPADPSRRPRHGRARDPLRPLRPRHRTGPRPRPSGHGDRRGSAVDGGRSRRPRTSRSRSLGIDPARVGLGGGRRPRARVPSSSPATNGSGRSSWPTTDPATPGRLSRSCSTGRSSGDCR